MHPFSDWPAPRRLEPIEDSTLDVLSDYAHGSDFTGDEQSRLAYPLAFIWSYARLPIMICMSRPTSPQTETTNKIDKTCSMGEASCANTNLPTAE